MNWKCLTCENINNSDLHECEVCGTNYELNSYKKETIDHKETIKKLEKQIIKLKEPKETKDKDALIDLNKKLSASHNSLANAEISLKEKISILNNRNLEIIDLKKTIEKLKLQIDDNKGKVNIGWFLAFAVITIIFTIAYVSSHQSSISQTKSVDSTTNTADTNFSNSAILKTQRRTETPPCEIDKENIILKIGQDSTILFFRTSPNKDASWDEWQSVTVQKVDHFLVTNGHKTSANKIQYYFIAPDGQIGSKNAPTEKSICENNTLSIETY